MIKQVLEGGSTRLGALIFSVRQRSKTLPRKRYVLFSSSIDSSERVNCDTAVVFAVWPEFATASNILKRKENLSVKGINLASGNLMSTFNPNKRIEGIVVYIITYYMIYYVT